MKKALLVSAFFFVVLFLFGSRTVVQDGNSATTAASAFMHAPLAFVPNQGQFDPEAAFSAMTPGFTLWLTPRSLVFDAGSGSAGRSVSRLEFLGVEPEVRITAEEPSGAAMNCYRGSDPSRWKTGLPTSAAVRYARLYPGIDLKVYGTGGAIEYDWIVDPGGDPGRIRFKYEGTEAAGISTEGDLVVRMPFGELRHRKPVCSQEVSGGYRAVDAAFKDLGEGLFGFEVGAYDRGRTLVIDPLVLAFSTYIGGTEGEQVENIAVDSQGAVYGAGNTVSSDFPRKNAADETYGGDREAFLFKFDSRGRLVFSTLLGGSDRDSIYKGVAVSPDGSVWVAGGTRSTDFPILKALDPTHNGDSDAFVAHLGTDGALKSSSYLGGSQTDIGWDIAVGPDLSVVITGYTYSANFPVKKAYDKKWNGAADVFLIKLNSRASAVVFSTFFGGSEWDDSKALAMDSLGSIYFTGETLSPDMPVLNAFDATYNGGGGDGYVAKFSKGGSLIYSTYFGGGSREIPEDIALDSKGGAVIVGGTSTVDFPVKNAFQPKKSGLCDAYIIKFLPSGQALDFSTYLGGSKDDCAYAVCVDSSGRIWVGGESYSKAFPLKNPWSRRFAGKSEGFISRFSPSGGALELSTFIGGNNNDTVKALALGTDNSLYAGGGTKSADFKVKKAYYPKLKGEADCYIVKFRL
ncbi:MAG: hypothetical protein JW742_01485 [Candidatus Aminicenantes bacterium]|nr:hypothetical protein [Candidatus Aminicenantes bacterium]